MCVIRVVNVCSECVECVVCVVCVVSVVNGCSDCVECGMRVAANVERSSLSYRYCGALPWQRTMEGPWRGQRLFLDG